MAKFRKRPVVIDAVRVKDVIDAGVFSQGFASLPAWVGEAYRDRKLAVFHEGITIPTLEGLMTGSPDDWLIRGIKGELYPCKPDVFEATYEKAES